MNDTSLPPVKFLLVDDLEENLVALAALLRRDGLELLTARSGMDALELLLVHEVALALIDVQMPDMDGFELATLMRGTERTRRIPIIFVTAGLRDQQHMFAGYDAGAVDFLFKPIDPQILRHKVDTFFQLHRQKQLLDQQLERLRESEEFRHRMLEGSQDCISVLDRQGRVLSLHAQAPRRFAMEDSAAVRGTDWAALWRPEHHAAALDSIEQACHGQAGRFVAELAVPAAAGTWWDVVITPIRDASGAVDRLLAVARDITDHKRAQAEQERLTQELEETLRLSEILIAAVGHDLRSPLNAIILSAQTIIQHPSHPDIRHIAERMCSSGKRMSRMIGELLDLARARLAGGIPIQPEPADLLDLARKVLAEHRTAECQCELALEHQGELRGQWDGDRLAQVLSNLVGNALRHGTPGMPVRVILDGQARDHVQLAVHNAGVIDPAVMPAMFDPFRSGRTGQRRSDGLGLGLYIVQQIVLAHGGNVDVQSSHEAGTTFAVMLPRQCQVAK